MQSNIANQENLAPEQVKVQEVNVEQLIDQLYLEIKNVKTTTNLEQAYKYYATDDDLKKIKKQRRVKKIKDLQTDSPTSQQLQELQDRVETLLNDTKNIHVDAVYWEKLYQNVVVDKERLSKENGKLRGQYKILENLKSDLEKKMHERHDEYSKIVEDEKQKKADLLNGFQDEIKQIQEEVDTKGNNKAQKQNENENLKMKMKEVQEHIDKRTTYLEDELNKQEKDRKEREQKIEEQIANIELNFGSSASTEESMAKLQEDQVSVDNHLNPYLAKTEEFHGVIEQTNKQFELYRNEMQRLSSESQKIETTSIQLQRKCEKNDLYIVEIAEEVSFSSILLFQKNLKLQEEVEKQSTQLNTLQNLLATLQAQLK